MSPNLKKQQLPSGGASRVALGIDPGSRRVGYGIVQEKSGGLTLLGAGILRIQAQEHRAALQEVRREILDIVALFEPQRIAIERLFFARNQKTALTVSETRGVILLAAHETGCEVQEFTPTEVKECVTGFGGADKKAVEKMVKLLLREPTLRLIDDAIDALAISIASLRKL